MRQIEVEGVGTMRELTDWQLVRLNKLRGPNRAIAPMAFGLGMTYQQYRNLTPEQQRACWEAFYTLMKCPVPTKRDDRPRWLPRPWERISEEQQVMIGRKLLQVKAELPHGHFRVWIDEKSGLTRGQAARLMKVAKKRLVG